MRSMTTQKLSIILGGGMFAVAFVGLAAAAAGAAVPFALEGGAAVLGMALGAKVA